MTKHLIATLVGMTLLISLTACARAASESRPMFPKTMVPIQPARPVRIMPLGDSITDGMSVPGGYRSDLWQFFGADERTLQFVGSEYGGPPTLGDRDHEGHPGWEIGQIDQHVTAWLRTYEPDLVLLHIGTNDIIHNKAAHAPGRLRTLLAHIVSAAPNAQVYVARIIPLRAPKLDARVRRYNQAISQIVGADAAAGMHMHLVDMHSAVRATDLLPDGIHPDGGGYSKMAARWYGALRSAPMTRMEAENPANVTVNDGERLKIASASGAGKVGYLNNADSFLEFKIKVATTGWRRLYVRAANGMTTPCSQQVTMNGRPQGLLRYPHYGRDQWMIKRIDIPLNAGDNMLRLSHDSCSAEIDSIDFAPKPADP